MLPKAGTIHSAPTGIPPSAVLRPLALFGIGFGALSTIADPDLWGHLRFGLDIITSGHVRTTSDPYSFTADRPFLYHEWLGGVVMGVAYRVGGTWGLMVLKAFLAIIPAALAWSALKRTQFAWRWFGVALVSWGTLALAFTLRPQLWTAIALFVVCRVLTSGSRRALWSLPLLFAAWANLHGGWIVGGALLAVWTTKAWLERSSQRWHFLLVGITSLAATLLTPYGVDLWMFLAETVRLNRNDISEWSPIWRAGPGFSIMWTATITFVALSWRRWGRPTGALLFTLMSFAYASARVNRLVPLFAIVSVALISRQWPNDRSLSHYREKMRAVLDGTAVAMCLLVAFALGGIPQCISLDHDTAPDTVAAEALRGAQGRLVTHFNWGEYALWHFGPALRVSIDGRRETIYTSTTIEEQQAIPEGLERGLKALERITPEYVWLPSSATTTAGWLTNHGYRIDIRTKRSYVAVRADLPRLSAWAGTTSGCFPGP